METPNSSERRLHPRKDLDARIDYSGQNGVQCLSLIDISFGGMRLLMDQPEKPGTKIRLTLQFSTSSLTSIISGQVVWARQLAPYEIGIRFLSLDANFVHLVHRLLSDENVQS
jgi:hypothetical protein